MRHALLFLTLLLAAQTAQPQQPGIVFPKTPDVTPPPPPPPPKADPSARAKLLPDQYYVIASGRPLLVLQTGTGEVTVTPRTPPFMLPLKQTVGWPADPKDPEFVTWGPESKYLYVVKAAKTGTVDLLVFPAVTEVDPETKQQVPLTEKDAVRKGLDVSDGKTPAPSPQPGPGPSPGPGPGPSPGPGPAPNPTKGFRAVFLYDNEKLSTEQLHIVNSSKIAAYLNQKCAKGDDGRPEWRKWDMTTVDRPGGLDREPSKTMRRLFTDAKASGLGALPKVVIAVDAEAAPFAWPETEQKMLDFLKQYGG